MNAAEQFQRYIHAHVPAEDIPAEFDAIMGEWSAYLEEMVDTRHEGTDGRYRCECGIEEAMT